VCIEAEAVSRLLRNGSPILDEVSVVIEPGQVVAVVGASGSGKTTLLETLAGLRLPSSGRVLLAGRDVHAEREELRGAIGYVPQDDIIHRELPVRATIRHAARLRLPELDGEALERRVDETIDALGLTDRSMTTVGRLSGGQRKRVSIAVELLTGPRVFFLDEPTSGLDPGTARALVGSLRSLAANGSTVMMTTHSPDDVAQCDQVIVLLPGGRLAFQGPPADALEHFGVTTLADVYRVLDDTPRPGPAPAPSDTPRAAPCRPATGSSPAPRPRRRLRHQWAVLSRRNIEVLARNRLTLAIMLGAPVLVIGMFVILFRPGAFDRPGDPLAAVGTTYWLAFAAFFFGLTYGLLQVVTEMAVVRRERHVGVGVVPYLLAKVAVLLPVLLGVVVAMVAALDLTGRLPGTSPGTTAALIGILVLDAVAALALGLLTSAAVSDPSQATLALPMLCFPAVLFGGAVLPVNAMATAGQLISVVTPDRWAFESLGRILDLPTRFGDGAGAALVTDQHGQAFSGGAAAPAILLVAFAAAFVIAAVRVLDRRTAVH
jgi:ABC-type multidrug transport system ATPase subunit